MMAGHALLAFTVVAGVAAVSGIDRRNALVLGVTAAVFAALPDVDILYAWKELLLLFTGGVFPFVDAFWSASQVAHRGISHSLVTAVLAGAGFSVYFYNGWRWTAALMFTSMTGGTLLLAGFLPAFIIGVLMLIGLAATEILREHTDISPWTFLAVVVFGLVSHPFGDVFTGTPPDFLYPLGPVLLTERMILHADPTLNLLAIFLLELGLIWSALATYTYLTRTALSSHIHPLAVFGLLYSIAPFALPAPTLQASYQFVFSILATGIFTAGALFLSHGTVPDRHSLFSAADLNTLRQHEPDLLTVTVTGATAITLAFAGYLLAYLFLL